jgi:hypothetical protein
VDVHFVRGRIAETRDSTRVATDTVIGTQLLRRALVNDSQLRAALTAQETAPRPLGTLLVEAGFVSEADLIEVLSRQIASTLVAAKLETAGSFVFVADTDGGPVDFITIDTSSVLMDISALGGQYCLAVEVLGQADTVLVRNTRYETLPHAQLVVGRDEFFVLALVDDRRTVAEIVEVSRLEELTVVSILGRMVEAGVLLVRAEPGSRAAGAAGLQAHRESVWAEVSLLLDALQE